MSECNHGPEDRELAGGTFGEHEFKGGAPKTWNCTECGLSAGDPVHQPRTVPGTPYANAVLGMRERRAAEQQKSEAVWCGYCGTLNYCNPANHPTPQSAQPTAQPNPSVGESGRDVVSLQQQEARWNEWNNALQDYGRVGFRVGDLLTDIDILLERDAASQQLIRQLTEALEKCRTYVELRNEERGGVCVSLIDAIDTALNAARRAHPETGSGG